MSVNEQFTDILIYQEPGYGYMANGYNGVSGVATFKDSYCAAFNPDGEITTEVPQNPTIDGLSRRCNADLPFRIDNSRKRYSCADSVLDKIHRSHNGYGYCEMRNARLI